MNIPVFLSSDNNYAPFVATTVASICNNTKSFVDFYILDGGITDENRSKIKSLKTRFKNFSIEFIGINIEKYFKDFPETKTITKSMYSRFLIPDLKPEINKAIYSDVDAIALGDINEIFKENLEKYALGAIWEEFGENTENIKRKNRLKLNTNHKYFNSGNLLINCNKWRGQNISQKLLSLIKQYKDSINCPDQDILNIYFNNNYKILEPKYCWINQNYEFYIESNNIIMRHFNGPIKPWHIYPDIIEDKRLSFTIDFKKFWHYAKMTPFYNEILEKVQIKNNLELKKYLVYKLMREKTGAAN